jgi:hypothetical protein
MVLKLFKISCNGHALNSKCHDTLAVKIIEHKIKYVSEISNWSQWVKEFLSHPKKYDFYQHDFIKVLTTWIRMEGNSELAIW